MIASLILEGEPYTACATHFLCINIHEGYVYKLLHKTMKNINDNLTFSCFFLALTFYIRQ